MASKESKNTRLLDKISLKRESAWLKLSEKDRKEVTGFCEYYRNFIDKNKTERECVQYIIKELESSGFKNISKVKKLSKGSKVYKNIKGKAIIAIIVGSQQDSFNIVGAHMDSPRLDLKPIPVHEDCGIGMLKSHYYGGIKKYHWVNVPLSMHGIIHTKKGERVELKIGEKESDPKFIISDLLPHLADEQMKKPARKIVEGEQLGILVANIPVKDEEIKEKVKFEILNHLNDKYGIIEEDFTSAEIEFVPADKAQDIGFDRSMVAAYGQDDKVCTYTLLRALLDIRSPKKTAVALFADKEEIGSYGDTGAASFMLKRFTEEVLELLEIKKSPLNVLENSNSVSADVTAAINPNFSDVHDKTNTSYLGHGVSLGKYGGAGGKYSTNDASAEYMQYIRRILNKNKIPWQTGEMGKIDAGGGGTIAMFFSRYGMNCVDVGPSVLGMHSTKELTSKADIYSAYIFYKAFFKSV